MRYAIVAAIAILLLLPLYLTAQTTISISKMVETTVFSPTDILYIVLNPGGVPLSRKITAANLLKHNRSCEVVFGSADPAATALTDNADQPRSCRNITGADQTITAVACNADAGSPTITPILTGGGAIVTGAITCGNGANWTAGTVSGTPTLHSFAANGATCSSAPCTLDANLTAANGAKYVIIGFTILSQ